MIKNERPKTELKTSDFYYDLPEELIAQTPDKKRDHARLLVYNRKDGSVEHKHFYDIIDYLNEGDTLVINDSRVIPARLLGVCEGRGDSEVELLLLRQTAEDKWECLARPGKKAKIGAIFSFGGGILRAEIVDIKEDGNRIVHFIYDKKDNFFSTLDRVGITPLPPYIKEKCADPERYQTVYSKEKGSAAAPTAGLHFTEELLEKIRKKGIAVVPVMLHVGLGTFRPVKEEDINAHVMHSEYISVSKEAADIINSRRAAGGRTVCVGTTSARTVESVSDDNGTVHPYTGDTGIFIYPGYKFKATDALITNFHLPESTLLMLISALITRETALSLYKTAVEERYRFFSFGDAMFIR